MDSRGTNSLATDIGAVYSEGDGSNGRGPSIMFKDATDLAYDLTAGKTYRFQCDMKVASGDACGLIIEDSSSSYADRFVATTFNNTVFTSVVGYFNATDSNEMQLKVDSFSNTDKVWLDNFKIQEIPGGLALYGLDKSSIEGESPF